MVRKYTDFRELKSDEDRFWQSLPAQERIGAVSELMQEVYSMERDSPYVTSTQRTLVRFETAMR
jgi:hypothetical protein